MVKGSASSRQDEKQAHNARDISKKIIGPKVFNFISLRCLFGCINVSLVSIVLND